MKTYENWISAADTPPPKDGSPFLACIDTDVKRLFWESGEAAAQRYGGHPDHWEACFVEVSDPDIEHSPQFWLPDDALPPPPTK